MDSRFLYVVNTKRTVAGKHMLTFHLVAICGYLGSSTSITTRSPWYLLAHIQ
jgi:hypothetical protein